MSRYTTEVRFICETYAGHNRQQGFKRVEDILTLAAPKVFDFDFPIFDEEYRLPLERKILRHFYTREICEESIGLWKLRLDDKLNEIMPYYNQLYESELIAFNPMWDTNLQTKGTRTDDGTKWGSSEETENTNSNKTSQETDETFGETGATKDYEVNQTSEGTQTDKTHEDGTQAQKTNTDTELNEKTSATSNETFSDEKQENYTGDSVSKPDIKLTQYGTEETENTRTYNGVKTADVGYSYNEQWDAFSDTPQGGLSNVKDMKYLTTADYKDNDTDSGNTRTVSGSYTDEGKTDYGSGDRYQTETGSTTNAETHSDNITETSTKNTTSTGTLDSTKNETQEQIEGHTVDGNAQSATTDITDTDYSERDTGSEHLKTTKDYEENKKGSLIGNVITNSTSKNLAGYTEHLFGKHWKSQKSFSNLLLEFRETFLNIDAMILDDLRPLFFCLWE